jgi:hypothetical protein
MIQFGRETCGDLNAALRLEFLETNGIGGFASSTVVGLNTRRYPDSSSRPPNHRSGDSSCSRNLKRRY